ncbi:inclusion body family protein [Paracoccus fistulariae]|uniref:Inclusion body family protein n=1 Tax=Paracoccus fistulariae TaxID=658446 RepID=A0ABY7SJX1_9RHOB|nr:inclusion body family protein [Paracoccus fistulariae]MDB6183168.1 inclusion body family protein [Paracoccus fistulariae]WCR07306.1 inclusion body family protein [Paracoccus fistulariae]
MPDDPNESIIDILMVIDAETLLASGATGTADAPAPVGADLIWLIVRSGNAVFGQGSKELKITAKTMDTLRWRCTSMSLNAAYSGMLYKFFALKGGSLISKPQPLDAQVTTPLPNPADPTQPGAQTITSAFWSATVLAQGEVTYTFCFMILDRTGKPLGYFKWDPFISITT